MENGLFSNPGLTGEGLGVNWEMKVEPISKFRIPDGR
jgi:hypothetical protein